MNKQSLTMIASVLALGCHLAPAQALNNVSSVASFGNDVNPCTRPSPCRTLQRAHDATNPGGTVLILDPGGYSQFTITKAISIVNDGAGAALIATSTGTGSGAGVRINAGATDKVYLRGLVIHGFAAADGIEFNSGGSLIVQNCVIRRLTGIGIIF